MSSIEITVFYPTSIAAWREWLEENHLKQQSVWIVFYKKQTGIPSITWSEAVDVALCFGWIDSKKIKIDEQHSHQFFSKRKEKSTWSKINKNKVTELIRADLMTSAGYESVEIAKQNGSWTLLDEVEELIIPDDLRTAFLEYSDAAGFFDQLSKSTRKAMLQWLVLAKRPETRQKRIVEIASLAALKQKPKQF